MRITFIALIIFAVFTILITGFWDCISSKFLPNETWGLYSKTFFENVLVEAHGAIIDLLVVGVILVWFEQRRDRKDQIDNLESELADLRLYKASDAPHRTLGTIRRLIHLGKSNLQLSEMTLSDIEIKDLKLSNCNLHATIFTNTRMSNVQINNCRVDAAIFAGTVWEHTTITNSSLRRSKFHNARLKGIDLSSCQIQHADFTNASLRSAYLKGLDCQGVKFKNTDLRSANLIGAKNLALSALLEAKDIKNLKSDDPVIIAAVAAAK